MNKSKVAKRKDSEKKNCRKIIFPTLEQTNLDYFMFAWTLRWREKKQQHPNWNRILVCKNLSTFFYYASRMCVCVCVLFHLFIYSAAIRRSEISSGNMRMWSKNWNTRKPLEISSEQCARVCMCECAKKASKAWRMWSRERKESERERAVRFDTMKMHYYWHTFRPKKKCSMRIRMWRANSLLLWFFSYKMAAKCIGNDEMFYIFSFFFVDFAVYICIILKDEKRELGLKWKKGKGSVREKQRQRENEFVVWNVANLSAYGILQTHKCITCNINE